MGSSPITRYCISIVGTARRCNLLQEQAAGYASYFAYSWNEVHDPETWGTNMGKGHYTFLSKDDATLFKLANGGEYTVSG